MNWMNGGEMPTSSRNARVAGLSWESQLGARHDSEEILFVGTDGNTGIRAFVAGCDARITDIVVVVTSRTAHDFAGSSDAEFLARGLVRLLFHKL